MWSAISSKPEVTGYQLQKANIAIEPYSKATGAGSAWVIQQLEFDFTTYSRTQASAVCQSSVVFFVCFIASVLNQHSQSWRFEL